MAVNKLIKPKSARGGARPNSGPKKPPEPKVRRSIGLFASQWAIFDEFGGSDWLRDQLKLDKKKSATESP